MSTPERKIPDYLLQLIEGCSNYAKISQQFWMVLLFFSIVAVSPDSKDGSINLPFGLHALPLGDFYPFTFVAIAVVIIGFGSATAQAVRARLLIQRGINLEEPYLVDRRIAIQDVVDMMLHPALNRVAPLVQFAQGKRQFFPEATERSLPQKILLTVYYALLKVMAMLVMFVFPGYALFISFIHFYLSNSIWHIPAAFFWLLGIMAALILIQLLYEDVRYGIKAGARIWRNKMEK